MFERMTVAAILAFASVCGAGEGGKFVDLGVQVTSFTLQGTAFAKLPDGRNVVCSVVRGQPAKLIVYDVRTGEMLHRMPLAEANGGWNATTATDGSVYVGTDNNGHLYRWIPGESEVHDLGLVLKDQSFAWDVAPGRDGEVFVGTYPGCNVVRYHPREGFSDIGKGSVAPGENYVRSVTFDPASGKVYAGVGSHAHLVEIDPKTGEKNQILPEKYADQEFAYTVDVIAGKLFVQLSLGKQTLVMDPATHEVETVLPDVGLQNVSPKSPYEDAVYYAAGGGLCKYDLKNRQSSKVDGLAKQQNIGMTWITLDEPDFKGPTLIIQTPSGKLTWFNPKSGKIKRVQGSGDPENVPIQSIARGPDGRIYCGGYLVGGLSAFDPKTGKHQQYNPISQSEGIGIFKSKLFLGIYPRARLYAFDTADAWGRDNPHLIDTLGRVGQDRPFAVCGVESLNKVFYGTVPDYGKLGGLIAEVDADSYDVKIHRDVVKDQSIISLIYANKLLVGGTTISGGLGIEATEKDAKLFLWDPAKAEKVFETTPVPDAKIVSGLMIGPDQNVWGMANGQLFIFDVEKRAVTFTKKLFPATSARPGWRDAFLAVHPSGQIYGTSRDHLFRLDPKSKEMTVLRDNATLLAIDNDGRVYFKESAHLWQYTP